MRILNYLHPTRKLYLLISIFLLPLFFTACFYYHVTTKTDKLVEKDIENFNKNQKFFILHTPDTVYHLQYVNYKTDSLNIFVEPLIGHQLYKKTRPRVPNRYKYKKNEQDVIYEVHLYTDNKVYVNRANSLAIADIKKVELYQCDYSFTTQVNVFSVVAIGGGVVAIVALIAVLTKSSCPFVYVSDGNQYIFTGEIYSGAIHNPIERHDYLKLPRIAHDNNLYKIKITNEVKEIQYTNLAELVVYDHPENTEVLVDKYGQPQLLSNIEKPFLATDLQGKDILKKIENKDTMSYTGDTSRSALTDGIILKFNKPQNSKNMRLIVRAKNTFWLDYAFGKFYDLFGIAYNTWQKRQDTTSKEELLKWGRIQNIPLSVYIEKNGKWEYADNYNVAGPMAFKDDILYLNVDSSDAPLKLKLECGHNFWEIDYIAADFNENSAVTTIVIPAKTATNEKKENIADFIAKDDSLYYIQPDVGNIAEISFNIPAQTDKKRTVFLHSKGHYQILRNPSGIPDKKYLQTFSNPGRFNEFSNELLNTKTTSAK